MKRSPIKRRSRNKNTENAARKTLLIHLADIRGPDCEARTVACTGQAQDAHEKLQRSAQGSAVDPENILLVCRSCHSHIHNHPSESFENGLLIHSWSKK